MNQSSNYLDYTPIEKHIPLPVPHLLFKFRFRKMLIETIPEILVFYLHIPDIHLNHAPRIILSHHWEMEQLSQFQCRIDQHCPDCGKKIMGKIPRTAPTVVSQNNVEALLHIRGYVSKRVPSKSQITDLYIFMLAFRLLFIFLC